jgi:hypothetical protein
MFDFFRKRLSQAGTLSEGAWTHKPVQPLARVFNVRREANWVRKPDLSATLETGHAGRNRF